MFRELIRIKQKLTEEECIKVLMEQPRGVLSMHGDDGYPYGVPVNHYYCPEDGKIYFHGSGRGHKADSLARCNKVSLCVYDEGFRREGEWALNIKSVVVFGRAEILEDEEKMFSVLRGLTGKFTDDEEYIEAEMSKGLRHVRIYAVTADHICGKLVNES